MGQEQGRLWNLWELINFNLRHVCHLLRHLSFQEARSEGSPGIPTEFPFQAKKDAFGDVNELINSAVQLGAICQSDPIMQRAGLFSGKFHNGISWAECQTECRVLRETIESQLSAIHLYQYPKEKGALYINSRTTWKKVFAAFPSLEQEAMSGIDCFSMGHNTACVFHMMRVAEGGLRFLAHERRVKTVRKTTPIEWGTWAML